MFEMALSLWRSRTASSTLKLFANTLRGFSSGTFISPLIRSNKNTSFVVFCSKWSKMGKILEKVSVAFGFFCDCSSV